MKTIREIVSTFLSGEMDYKRVRTDVWYSQKEIEEAIETTMKSEEYNFPHWSGKLKKELKIR